MNYARQILRFKSLSLCQFVGILNSYEEDINYARQI